MKTKHGRNSHFKTYHTEAGRHPKQWQNEKSHVGKSWPEVNDGTDTTQQMAHAVQSGPTYPRRRWCPQTQRACCSLWRSHWSTAVRCARCDWRNRTLTARQPCSLRALGSPLQVQGCSVASRGQKVQGISTQQGQHPDQLKRRLLDMPLKDYSLNHAPEAF